MGLTTVQRDCAACDQRHLSNVQRKHLACVGAGVMVLITFSAEMSLSLTLTLARLDERNSGVDESCQVHDGN